MSEELASKPLTGRNEWVVRSLSGIAIVLIILICTIPEKLGLTFLSELNLVLWITLNAFLAGYGSYEYRAMALRIPRNLGQGLWRVGLVWALFMTLLLLKNIAWFIVGGLGLIAVLLWFPPYKKITRKSKRDVLSLSIIWFFIPCFAGVGLFQINESVLDMTAPLFVFLSMWTTDTFAFIFGKLFGRTKMAPTISPGKTWEGTLGGLAAAATMGWLVNTYWQNHTLTLNPLIIAPLLGAAGVIGDLLQSLAKRRFGVKDSGTLIPGHGGVFDRFDSYLVAAPLLALLLWLF